MDIQTTIAVINLVCASTAFIYYFGAQFVSHKYRNRKEDGFQDHQNQNRPGEDDNTEQDDERAGLTGSSPTIHYHEALLSLAFMIILSFLVEGIFLAVEWKKVASNLAADLTVNYFIIIGITWCAVMALPTLTAYCYLGPGFLTGVSQIIATALYHANTPSTGLRRDLLGVRYARIGLLVLFMVLVVLALRCEHSRPTSTHTQQFDGASTPPPHDDDAEEQPQRASRWRDMVNQLKQTFNGLSAGGDEDTESLLAPPRSTYARAYGSRDPGHSVRQPLGFSFSRAFAKSTSMTHEEEVSPFTTRNQHRVQPSNDDVSTLRLVASQPSSSNNDQIANSFGNDTLPRHTATTLEASEPLAILRDDETSTVMDTHAEQHSLSDGSAVTAIYIGPKKTKFREELSDIGEDASYTEELLKSELDHLEDQAHEVIDGGSASTSYVRNVVAMLNAHAGSIHSNDQAEDSKNIRRTSSTYNQRNVSGSSVRWADENNKPEIGPTMNQQDKGKQRAVDIHDLPTSVPSQGASSKSQGRSTSLKRKSRVPSNATLDLQTGDPLAASEATPRISQISAKRQRVRNRRQQARSDPTNGEHVGTDNAGTHSKQESGRRVSAPGEHTVGKKRRRRYSNKSRQPSGNSSQGEGSTNRRPPGTWVD